MTERFVTNAQTREELDLAISEAESWTGEGVRYSLGGLLLTPPFLTADQFLDRTAFVDYRFDASVRQASRWWRLRERRPSKRIDHSSHNLFPFTGKIHPQLARACINLATANIAEPVICDPFCGSGTVALEANLMGIRSLSGDIDPFAVWLTQTKLLTDAKEFERRLARVESLAKFNHDLVGQRYAAAPTKVSSVALEDDAVDLLGLGPFDGIVTSPPYFDAINYNSRHREMRSHLGLPSPDIDSTIGSGQSLESFIDSVAAVARAMASQLKKPHGKVVLVTAPFRGVDTPYIWEKALCLNKLCLERKLTRTYSQPVLGISQELVMVFAWT